MEVAKMEVRVRAYLLLYFFPIGGATSIMKSLYSLKKLLFISASILTIKYWKSA